MNAFFAHLGLPLCASVLLYAIYIVFLKNGCSFRVNRFYLIFSILFSFILPFIHLPLPAQMTSQSSEVLLFQFQLREIEIINTTYSGFPWLSFIIFIYWIGVVVFASLFLIKLMRLGYIIMISHKEKQGKMTLVLSEKSYAPFSFFSFVVINKNEIENSGIDQILFHEQAHINQKHTIDILLVEIAKIFQWFNPIFNNYGKALKSIHEYSADEFVLQQGVDIKEYMQLLFRQTTGYNLCDITHNFNNLLTKNRIKMMTRKKLSKWSFAKIGWALPIVAFLLLSNCKSKTEPTPATEVSQSEVVNHTKTDSLEIITTPDVMPQFPGGEEAMYQYLVSNLTYPQDAIDNQIQGIVYIEFTVDKEGNILNIRAKNEIHPSLNKEAIRIVESMPKWIPGKHKGEDINTNLTLPIRFALS